MVKSLCWPRDLNQWPSSNKILIYKATNWPKQIYKYLIYSSMMTYCSFHRHTYCWFTPILNTHSYHAWREHFLFPSFPLQVRTPTSSTHTDCSVNIKSFLGKPIQQKMTLKLFVGNERSSIVLYIPVALWYFCKLAFQRPVLNLPSFWQFNQDLIRERKILHIFSRQTFKMDCNATTSGQCCTAWNEKFKHGIKLFLGDTCIKIHERPAN